MKKTSSFPLILAAAVLSATALQAEQLRWPSWRGAADAGSTAKGTYPAKLDDDHLLWQVDLPGRGCSTPIVWDDLIILTAAKGEEDGVLAYDWKGKKVWDATVGKRRKGKHRNGSSSNSSAVTDGEFVFVYFKSGNLGALNLEGKVLWKHNLQQRYGRDTLYWDIGTSPVITREHVVVAVMNDRKGFLVAFDKGTGEEAWKVDRTYETPVEGDHSYATPHVIEEDGRQVLVVWGAERVTTHEAKNGKLISECAGFNPQKRSNWVVVSSSVIVDDMVIVPYGRGKCLAGVKLEGRVMSRRVTGCGSASTTRGASCPPRRCTMARSTSSGTGDRCTVSIRRRGRPSGKASSPGERRATTPPRPLRTVRFM